MNSTLLVIGTVVVILAIAGALVVYLYIIGSFVEHIAETLSEKIAPGAQEVGEHASAIGPAAIAVRRRLGALGQLRRVSNDVSTAGR